MLALRPSAAWPPPISLSLDAARAQLDMLRRRTRKRRRDFARVRLVEQPLAQAEALASKKLRTDEDVYRHAVERVRAIEKRLVMYDRENYDNRRGYAQQRVHTALYSIVLAWLLRDRYARFMPRLEAELDIKLDSSSRLVCAFPRRFGKTQSLTRYVAVVLCELPGFTCKVGATTRDIASLFLEEVKGYLVDMLGTPEYKRRAVVEQSAQVKMAHEGTTQLSVCACITAKVPHLRLFFYARRARSPRGKSLRALLSQKI